MPELPSRADVIGQLNAAYMKVAESRGENFVLAVGVMEKLGEHIRAFWDERGYKAPKAFYDYFYQRVMPVTLPDDRQAYIGLMAALVTDWGPNLIQHIRERLSEEGNFFGQVMGWTGSGKSSCALNLLDGISTIDPERFEDHVAIDLEDAPAKLQGKKPGQGIVLDEELELTGEGSTTSRKTFSNIENTLRASGVNMLICSPQAKEHDASQFVLEAILWNRAKRRTLFVAWVMGVPLGYVIIPWMRDELYAKYKPWKQKNVERTLRAQFRKENALFEMMHDIFGHDGFVTVLHSYHKINKTQLKAMIAAFFGHRAWVKTLRDQLADFTHDQLTVYHKLGDKYTKVWGGDPHPNFVRIAKKYYDE